MDERGRKAAQDLIDMFTTSGVLHVLTIVAFVVAFALFVNFMARRFR